MSEAELRKHHRVVHNVFNDGDRWISLVVEPRS